LNSQTDCGLSRSDFTQVHVLSGTHSPASAKDTRAPRAALGLSVVIPVFNEVENVEALSRRLTPVLEGIGRSYDVWFVDDGSSDGSLDLLCRIAERDERVNVIELTGNFGQHAAILAGFALAEGEVVVTLDADLQNPPEEIPRLLDELEQGHDMVSGRRVNRRDPLARRAASRLVNLLAAARLRAGGSDHGCMLRAYRRALVRELVELADDASFLPLLAYSLAKRTAEINVEHAPRRAGRSKYGAVALMGLFISFLVSLWRRPQHGAVRHRIRTVHGKRGSHPDSIAAGG
jgi:undecaprenyl-phosphate 4-deoxy-4-formamido-L-arabinose transferase